MIGSGDAFLGLLGATVPRLLAAIGDWFLHPISIGSIVKSNRLISQKRFLLAAPDRLLVLRDGPRVGRILAVRKE
jgi:hypothetical protein